MPMNDDWRVRAELGDHGQAADLADLLAHGELEHSLESAARRRVIVSVDGAEVFVYAADREQAERAAAALTTTARARGFTVTTELRRWHPLAERWEDPELPLPATDAESSAERADEVAQERAEAATLDYSEYEVRVALPTHRETVAVANQLRADGIPSLRRWRYLLIGAGDEQSANELAQRVTAAAPSDAAVTVEATAAAVEAELPPNPFAVFGGLGG